jgi:hypothetical protein
MRIALAAITLFCIGYYLAGGAFGILDYVFYELVWVNPVGTAIHNAVLGFDNARLTDLYAAIRTDFRFGIALVLVGFLSAMILPRRLDFLPWFFAGGVVVRMCVPVAIEIFLKAPKELVYQIPQFILDIASLPSCMLGTALGRLVRLRRIPRWRIRSFGLLTALLALWLTAGLQSPRLLLPFATCGLLGLLSSWLLIQTNILATPLSNPAVTPGGGPGPS